MSYTNIFGGYNINTAFPSYMSYTFSDNIQLNWASSFVDSPPGTNNITAQINDLNATQVNLTVTLADATLISVGQTIQFNNVGANPVTINDFSGGFLATIPAIANTNQYILYLQDNTTQAGIWGITHLGAGTTTADASVLAGLGTIALNSQINTNFPGKTIGANYQVVLSDRASILVWTGGAGTITLPNQIAGFYIAVNNEGSGVVSINTPDATTIDGGASFPLNPSESSYFIGVGGNWNTLGFGVESFFQVNVLAPIDLSAVNPSITLTNQQSSRLVHQFTGNLGNNVTVFYPATAGQWYIWNNTAGAFNVSVQLSGPTGNAVVIPQGEKVIIYSDGNSMYNTPTISTSAVFPDGAVGAPGINFQAQASTGFYRISSGLTGYASAGTQGVTFGGTIPGYGLGISGGLSSRYYNVANSQYVGFEAGVLAGNTIWKLPLRDATAPNQIMYSDGATNLGFTTATYPLTTVANQLLYSSATNVISGIATGNNGVLVTSGGGVPSIGNTLPLVVQGNIAELGVITTGVWNATPITVPFGGTGLTTLTTAYGVVCAGTTATNPLQNAGTGTINQILTSNGNAALGTWQNRSAVKADQITATSTTQFVNPAVQQFHPSAVKFWCTFNGQTVGTNPPISGYNVTSVKRTGVGVWEINFTVPFANTFYCCGVMSDTPITEPRNPIISAALTNLFRFAIVDNTGTTVDCTLIYVFGFGLQ
jgi:hypothetical protein